ncbi:DNA-binding response regulator [Sphingomonas profundi]|uniref:response regulator transcription factor n=1 Tax=Alterirhizorhabdus profundi TaxID=2681549 RepID=UPI001E506D94|nr:DNA-binding response regulator [Sphingomonas profundi]
MLVVDDTPDSLRFLTDTLEGAGMTVLIATDGEAALELLEHVTPDIVLMDAMMPGLDGFATTRRIKQDPRFAQAPIIFMTGLTETEHVVHGFAAGGVDYVHKPIVVEELIARIRVHLANARVAQGSHVALDASGRLLLAVDAAGNLLWSTPRADEVLGRLVPDWRRPALPAAIAAAVRRIQAADADTATARVDVGGSRLEFVLLNRAGPDEWLIRLTEAREGDDERILAARHVLTSREAEVLLWVSRGKPNREISEILGISPRTVNKHLEQVFEKLGVENRASAAAIAVRTLAG